MIKTTPPIYTHQSIPNTLPTMYNLPSEDTDEPGLPDEFHAFQSQLLRETFHPPNYHPAHIFIATDLNLYYDLTHPLWYKRPDWFAVLGVDRFYEQQDLRLSYVIWQELITPQIIIELLSPSTEDEDLGQTLSTKRSPPSKWTLYERILNVPHYLVYSRYSNELQVFALINGHYQQSHSKNNRYWLQDIGIGIGLWFGTYQHAQALWLRWYDSSGAWIPTPEETALQRAHAKRQKAIMERERANAEQQNAIAERRRVEALEQEIIRLRTELARFHSDDKFETNNL